MPRSHCVLSEAIAVLSKLTQNPHRPRVSLPTLGPNNNDVMWPAQTVKSILPTVGPVGAAYTVTTVSILMVRKTLFISETGAHGRLSL